MPSSHPAAAAESKRVGVCTGLVLVCGVLIIIVAIVANQSEALTKADILFKFNEGNTSAFTLKDLMASLAVVGGLVIVAAIIGLVAVFGCDNGLPRKCALSFFALSMTAFGAIFLASTIVTFVRHEVISGVIKAQVSDFCNKTTYARLVANIPCTGTTFANPAASRRLALADLPDMQGFSFEQLSYEQIAANSDAVADAGRRLWTADCGQECQARVEMLRTLNGCYLLAPPKGICGKYIYDTYGSGYPATGVNSAGVKVQPPMWRNPNGAVEGGKFCKDACNNDITCTGYVTIADASGNINDCLVISPTKAKYPQPLWILSNALTTPVELKDPAIVDPADGVITYRRLYSKAYDRFYNYSRMLGGICAFFTIFLFVTAMFGFCHLFTSSMVRRGKARGGQLCCLMLCPCIHDDDDEDKLREDHDGYSSNEGPL